MAKEKKAKIKEFAPNPYSLHNALGKGNALTRLSALIMGLGNFANKQIIKGLIFLAGELAFLGFMFKPNGGLYWISMLPSLGDRETEEVYNEALGIYEYVIGDNSQLILLYGVASLALCVVFIIFWRAAICSAYKCQCLKAEGKNIPNFKQELHSLLDENLYATLMMPPFVALCIFTILPLLYMMSMAFTNYSKTDDKLVLFDWVGLQTFTSVLNPNGVVGKQFWSVLGWTLVWAFFATFLCFFLGTIVAMMINRKTTRFKSFWRTIFSLTIAIPQFVSLLLIRTMFETNGIVNTMLQNMGLIKSALPFFTNTTWARVTIILINLWVGIPYTIMQVTGILQNIPADQYEAATIDGANPVQTFFNITLPYMLFVMAPNMISSFTGNINNFNIIYLLSGGGPTEVGNSAGNTDLLVTWLYKLSVDQQRYNVAAVIGILTFVVLAVVSLVTYRSTGSYKNEEGFR